MRSRDATHRPISILSLMRQIMSQIPRATMRSQSQPGSPTRAMHIGRGCRCRRLPIITILSKFPITGTRNSGRRRSSWIIPVSMRASKSCKHWLTQLSGSSRRSSRYPLTNSSSQGDTTPRNSDSWKEATSAAATSRAAPPATWAAEARTCPGSAAAAAPGSGPGSAAALLPHELARGRSTRHNHQCSSHSGEQQGRRRFALAKHIEVTKNVPVTHYQKQHVPYKQTIQVQVPRTVIAAIPKPLPIKIPVAKTVAIPQLQEVKIPIERVKPVPVERPIPFVVERRVPYRVEKPVATPVYYPYPVKVPVVRTVVHKQRTHYVPAPGWSATGNHLLG